MANILQFKRGSGYPGDVFYAGEPVFDESGQILIIGDALGVGAGAGTSIASQATYSAALEMLVQASASDSGSVRLYEDTDNGTNYVAIGASAALGSTFTLRLPDGVGGAGEILKTDGSGNLYWEAAGAGFSNFLIGDGTDTSTITDGETVTFTGGEGITANVDNGVDTVTISGEAASTTNAGIASYTTDFYFIDTWQVGVTTATASNAGIASFSSADFSVAAGGLVTLGNNIAFTDATFTNINVTGIGTIETLVVGTSASLASASVTDLTQSGIVYAGASGELTESANLTFDGTTFTLGATVGITSILDEDDFISDSATAVPTQQSVKAYVDGVDLTVVTAEGTNGTGGGGGSFNPAQTLTFSGTTDEIDVTVVGQTVTYGLPTNVSIGGSLTVNGDLRVVGTAVTFEAETLRIEDRLIELGLIDDSAPSSVTTWDSGVVFNWHDGSSALKSAVLWLDNTFVAVASSITENSGIGNTAPQVTVDGYAPILSGGLYIGGTAAGNEVINSSQQAVNLTFDGGTY
jgi:hypothetical protein